MRPQRRQAEPSPARVLGWALVRKTRCEICGDKREAQQRGYCTAHAQRLRAVLKRGVTESEWRQTTRPLPPFPSKCAIVLCVHDGEIGVHGEGCTYAPLCRSHHMHWRKCRLRSSGRLPDEDVWNRWLADACDGAAVHTADSRGKSLSRGCRFRCSVRSAMRFTAMPIPHAGRSGGRQISR
jgi:hypothetical protein